MDMKHLEAAAQQAICELEIQQTEAVLDEAGKWAKAWKLPPDRQPHRAGFSMICDMVVSCVMRDATIGMDRANVSRYDGEQMIRVTVNRQNRQLLHFVARVGQDEYLCWHHRDAEDEAQEDQKQRSTIIQSLSGGVRCALCNYNLGYVRRVAKTGLAPIVGYRCTVCSGIFCTKCHGKFIQGCPSCRATHEHLEILAAKLMPKFT
jgi:hypothetical protein